MDIVAIHLWLDIAAVLCTLVGVVGGGVIFAKRTIDQFLGSLHYKKKSFEVNFLN